jgi:hypothetical protein
VSGKKRTASFPGSWPLQAGSNRHIVAILIPHGSPSGPHGFRLVGFIFDGTIMTPVCVYIDGFNLYHALLKVRDNRVKWLDLNALSHRLISPKTEKVQSIFYFSALAHWLPDKMARHAIYVKALPARGVTCILGYFKSKDRRCNSCGATWVAHEEKETDVSIGINLVNDA